MLTYNTITHSVGRSVGRLLTQWRGPSKRRKFLSHFPHFPRVGCAFDGQLVKSPPFSFPFFFLSFSTELPLDRRNERTNERTNDVRRKEKGNEEEEEEESCHSVSNEKFIASTEEEEEGGWQVDRPKEEEEEERKEKLWTATATFLHVRPGGRAPSTNKGKCQSPQFSYFGQSSPIRTCPDESIHCNCVVSIIRQCNAIRRNEGRKEGEKQRAE